MGNGTVQLTALSSDLSDIVPANASLGQIQPGQPLADGSHEVIRARIDSVGNWNRVLNRWSLDSDSPTEANNSFSDSDPVSAYVTDAAIYPPRRDIAIPSASGTYTYTWEWQNTRGSKFTHTIELEKSAGGVTGRHRLNNEPFTAISMSPNITTLSVLLGMGLSRDSNPPSGILANISDDILEQKYIGTWTVTENMAGVVTVLGQFDLRMLALKNSRAVPASFDPALPDQTEGSSTNLRADVVALPFTSENDPDGWRPTGPVDWKISITNSDSTLIRTLTGSVNVTAPDSTGKVAEIITPWRGEQDGTATTLPGGSYSFKVLGLGPLGTFANTKTRPATGTVAIGDEELAINATVDPERFDPSDGGTATLSFDLISEGLGPAPEFDWTVSIEDAGSNTTLHTFGVKPGNPTNLGTTLHVELPWDGRANNGSPVAKEFDWVIQASATSPGGTVVRANTTVPNQNLAELVVTAGNKKRAETFSPTNPVLQSQLVDPLLRSVFPANESYTITAQGLQFEGPPPTTIRAQISSNISGQKVFKTLTFDTGTKSFVGTFDYSEVIWQRPTATLITSAAAIDKNGVFEAEANEWVDCLSSSILFPQPVAKVGQLLERLNEEEFSSFLGDPGLASTLFSAQIDPVTGQPGDGPANFLHYGFEGVNVTLIDDTGALTTTDLQAMVKVAQPANVAISVLHGRHDGGTLLLNGPTGTTVAPSAPRESAPGLVIFISCSNLDLHDYNNFYSAEHYPIGAGPVGNGGHPPEARLHDFSVADPTTGQNITFTPRTGYGGEPWFRAFAGRTVLLGYNGPSPITRTVSTAFGERISLGDRPIMAWLRANREVAATQPIYGWLLLNACAYDTNGDYYYIAYKAPGGLYLPEEPELTPGTLKPLGIYKVPASLWNVEADDWSEVPPKFQDSPLAFKVE